MIIDIVVHPRDLNLLFIAYEGMRPFTCFAHCSLTLHHRLRDRSRFGARVLTRRLYSWLTASVQKDEKPVRTFELTLSPGAPGGTGYHSEARRQSGFNVQMTI